jgi:hypothetical protein
MYSAQQRFVKRGEVGLTLARALLTVSHLKEANVIFFLLLMDWFLNRLKVTLHNGGVEHWPDDGLRSDYLLGLFYQIASLAVAIVFDHNWFLG